MTAKEYLRQYARAKTRAEIFKTEYEKEKNLIDTIRAAGSGDGTPSSGRISSPTEQKAIRLADKLTDYQNAELEALELKREILWMIELLQGDCATVLYERYINLKSWQEVADEIGYSLRQTHRFHQEGLGLIDMALNGTF